MAVSHKLQLEFRIVAESPEEDTVFTFDVPGTIVPRFVPVFRDASANGRTVEAVRTVLEVEGARLVASDTATLWGATKIGALRALIETQQPEWVVRLLRDTGGETPNVLWTLNATTYEQIRLEEVRGLATDELMAASSWLTVAPFTLVVSALRKFADGDGVVAWSQSVERSAGPSGFPRIRWVTEITTLEGVDARAKLLALGRIPIELLGTSWSYPTGNEIDLLGGVESVVLDADERGTPRTGTVVRGTSEVQQWGVEIGADGPGLGPSVVSYSERTSIDRGRQEIEYRASAQGPGALAWVQAQQPGGGSFAVSDLFYEHGQRQADGRWVIREGDPTQASGLTRTIQVEITGGHASFDFEPTADGFEPVEFDGPIMPWQVTVKVRVERQGGEGTNDQLPFPELLSSIGLRLDYDASTEGEPFAPAAADPAQRSWSREAVLVYRANRKPTVKQVRAAMEASQGTLESYYLG